MNDRLTQAIIRLSEKRRADLDASGRLLSTLGYQATLSRGYAVVRADDQVVTRKTDAEKAKALEIEFADGRLKIGGRKSAAAKDGPPEQGSLF